MNCPRCQHTNPQGARFCEECATPLARMCSNCGTALSATAKFCHACAHPVAAAAGAPSRSPDSYTPKHLAEKILTSKASLEGNHFQAALSIATEIGARPLAAHSHFSLGKLYRQAGKGEQAQEQLTIATAMYRDMGMTYWLEKAEAETAELV